MFRFFLRRKYLDTNKNLNIFLEEADEALIQTYETGQLSWFTKYASNNVLCLVSDKLSSKESTLFGTKKYRVRNWIEVSRTDSVILLKKELRHRHVRLSKTIYVAIGDDINEFWKISISKNRYVVLDIKEAM